MILKKIILSRLPAHVLEAVKARASYPKNLSGRSNDVFLMVDVCNHSLTYTVNGCENHKSPDDHYQDLKRMIAAIAGKAHRINVIHAFLI